jgi:hypothetical protein
MLRLLRMRNDETLHTLGFVVDIVRRERLEDMPSVVFDTAYFNSSGYVKLADWLGRRMRGNDFIRYFVFLDFAIFAYKVHFHIHTTRNR